MKLKNFFLLREAPGDPTFSNQPMPQQAAPQGQQPQQQKSPEISRWERLPIAIQNHVKDIKRQCMKLDMRNDQEPELGRIIHDFLAELTKYMGESK